MFRRTDEVFFCKCIDVKNQPFAYLIVCDKRVETINGGLLTQFLIIAKNLQVGDFL
jgi:hypothetical protein